MHGFHNIKVLFFFSGAWIISAFAPSIEWLIILMGAVTGIGIACNDIIFFSYLDQYFDNRLFVASGIAGAGGTLGIFIFPNMYIRLADIYGTRGSFIFVAGLWLNMCIAGALLRPMEGKINKYYARNSKENLELQEEAKFIGSRTILLKLVSS